MEQYKTLTETPPPDDIRRFLGQVEVIEGGCWKWTGYLDRDGYPSFKQGSVQWRASRWGFEVFQYQIPRGLCLDHLCRNRACVNPNHLEPVTMSENIKRGYRDRERCKRGHLLVGRNRAPGPNGAGYRCKICQDAKKTERQKQIRYLRDTAIRLRSILVARGTRAGLSRADVPSVDAIYKRLLNQPDPERLLEELTREGGVQMQRIRPHRPIGDKQEIARYVGDLLADRGV